MKIMLVLAVHLVLFVVVDSGHFLGGSISWKVTGRNGDHGKKIRIELQHRYILRCQAKQSKNQKDNGGYNGPGGGNPKLLQSGDSKTECPSNSGRLIDYDLGIRGYLSVKETTRDININSLSQVAVTEFEWVKQVSGNNERHMSMSVVISNHLRSDKKFNTPPSTTMPFVKFVCSGTPHTWTIPTHDVNGDIVRCRLANTSAECGGICGSLRDVLIADNCTITYKATNEKWLAIPLQIEDFENRGSKTALSSVPFQFIVITVKDQSSYKPIFHYIGSIDRNSMINVSVCNTSHQELQFSSDDRTINITKVTTRQSSGLKIDKLPIDRVNETVYRVNITWEPTVDDFGIHWICLTPRGTPDRFGDEVCIKYFVYKDGYFDDAEQMIDHFANVTMNPVGFVHPNQNRWEIEYPYRVKKPTQSNIYIFFYSASNDEEVFAIDVRNGSNAVNYSGTTLTFFTNQTWAPGEEYYILFDRSALSGDDDCGTQSPSISDPYFWRFRINGTKNETHKPSFVVEECEDPDSECNVFWNYCSAINPCQNNGTCTNTETDFPRYICHCPADFNGTNCEISRRPCQSNPCLNDGRCIDVPHNKFNCTCQPHWKGDRCEKKIDHCWNITCYNNGVCRSSLGNFTCECLGDSYYGRHCEFTDKKMIVHQYVSKSFAYIAMLALLIVASFVIVMDILKYAFGIDPAREEREKIQREKQRKKQRPVIRRYTYVNESEPSASAVPVVDGTSV